MAYTLQIGQERLALESESAADSANGVIVSRIPADRGRLCVVRASAGELDAHAKILRKMGEACIWNRYEMEATSGSG